MITVNTFAIWWTTALLPTYFSVSADPIWFGYMLVGLVVALLNMFVKPILKMLSLPFVVLTMGLFLIVINAIIIWLAHFLLDFILPSFSVEIFIRSSFWAYALIGFVLAVINGFFHWVFKK